MFRRLNNELTMISVYQDITDYSRNLKDLEKVSMSVYKIISYIIFL